MVPEGECACSGSLSIITKKSDNNQEKTAPDLTAASTQARTAVLHKMVENSPHLGSGSSVRHNWYPGNKITGSHHYLASPSPGRLRYTGNMMNVSLPPSSTAPRYPGNMMYESLPHLAPTSAVGPRYPGNIINENLPSLASRGPTRPRYPGNIMNESRPRLASQSPRGPRYPGHIMDDTCSTLDRRYVPFQNIQHRLISPGTNECNVMALVDEASGQPLYLQDMSSPNSAFLASGGDPAFDSTSRPQMSERIMSTPTHSYLLSGGSLGDKVSTRSRDQIALLPEFGADSSCPCPSDKIKSIAKRSFMPVSVYEARNNLTESIESHLKQEEPLEFEAVVNSVKTYQAMRRQVISSSHGDVGPSTTFRSGVKRKQASSPEY